MQPAHGMTRNLSVQSRGGSTRGPPAAWTNPRFVVTNLSQAPRVVYQQVYCARGDIENRIKGTARSPRPRRGAPVASDAGHRLVDPLAPLRQVEPAVAQIDQP